MSIENTEFRPKIVAFCCNWCSYAGADLAGSSRLVYPADVKIIRVPCSCRVNPMFILRAFEKGADGVIMCGCHPGDCHYSTGNYYARRRMTLLFSMLDFIGCHQGKVCVKARCFFVIISCSDLRDILHFIAGFSGDLAQFGMYFKSIQPIDHMTSGTLQPS